MMARIVDPDTTQSAAVPRAGLAMGLALSGGGVRASVFHLGVLSRLAEDGLLERVSFVSTVSGGSLVAGMIYAAAGNRWPTSRDFKDDVLPAIHRKLTEIDLQRSILVSTLTHPYRVLTGRANGTAESIRRL